MKKCTRMNVIGVVDKVCFGTKWYGDVPGARSTRDGGTENDDMQLIKVFCSGFLNLTKEVGLLWPGPCGPKVLRHQMVR